MRPLFLLTAVVGSARLASAEPPQAPVADVVVLATRSTASTLDVPASIDRVDGATLREGLGVNLSESLGAIPGVSAQSRQNFAQDLQLSIRGFGARSSFGARGIRLYADGVPATMPDGQGQYSHFDLSGADRVEVLRGPFSALYGNAAGGVIAIYTADPPAGGETTTTMAGGSYGTQRYALRAGGAAGSGHYSVDAAHFSTDGYRDHSRAERNTANGRLRLDLGPGTRLTLVANAIDTPAVEDPLGLTSAQLLVDPRQPGTGALAYDTRKSLSQQQVGATLQTLIGDADELSLMSYAGHRHTNQFQAIPRNVEALSLTHPGGVIDLARDYCGGELHLVDRRAVRGAPLTLTGGISVDALDEARRGYLNFDGNALGVLGALRRDDGNRVQSFDQYLQAEWQPAARWRIIAGVRHADVRITSRSHLDAAAPTAIDYAATNPVAGVTWRLRPDVALYASYGRGFETPTLNDLAYRSTDGSLPGLNTALKPARSGNYEIGAKLARGGIRATLAAFYIRTSDELAVKANSGGRSVLENIGRTQRRGAELTIAAPLASGLDASLAYTFLDATTVDAYTACSASPCSAQPVAAGSRLPAVPAHAIFASLTWRPHGSHFYAAAETVGRAGIYADDRNVNFASGYWVSNLRAGLEQSRARWTFTETLRIDNILDRRYVGSVIVNESNGRYFEPASGRAAYLTFNAAFR